MNKAVFVRITILNYNESNYTLELVEQLKNQTFQNFETVVVDNASNAKEKKILSQLPQDVTVLYSDENLGYARGNNIGLKYKGVAEPDFHLVLNNDLIIEDPEFILKMVEGIQTNRNVVASSPLVDTLSTGKQLHEQIQVRRILPPSAMFKLSTPIFTPFINKLTDHFLYRDQMPYLNKYLFCDSINGAAFMINNQFLQENNYLDEGTFLYFEELILGRQIINQNKTCLLNGFTSVKHLQGVSTKSSGKKINTKMERFKYESALYYLKKYDRIGFAQEKLFILLNELSIIAKKILKR